MILLNKICQMLLHDPGVRDEGKAAADKLHENGDLRPLCDFVERKYFKVFSNRDYRRFSQLGRAGTKQFDYMHPHV